MFGNLGDYKSGCLISEEEKGPEGQKNSLTFLLQCAVYEMTKLMVRLEYSVGQKQVNSGSFVKECSD